MLTFGSPGFDVTWESAPAAFWLPAGGWKPRCWSIPSVRVTIRTLRSPSQTCPNFVRSKASSSITWHRSTNPLANPRSRTWHDGFVFDSERLISLSWCTFPKYFEIWMNVLRRDDGKVQTAILVHHLSSVKLPTLLLFPNLLWFSKGRVGILSHLLQQVDRY